MTLLLSSMWLNFRPFRSIWRNFTSHRALRYIVSHIQRNPPNFSIRPIGLLFCFILALFYTYIDTLVGYSSLLLLLNPRWETRPDIVFLLFLCLCPLQMLHEATFLLRQNVTLPMRLFSIIKPVLFQGRDSFTKKVASDANSQTEALDWPCSDFFVESCICSFKDLKLYAKKLAQVLTF